MASDINVRCNRASCAGVATATSVVVRDRAHLPVPIHPKHNFVSIVVVPNIVGSIVGSRAWAAYIKCGGDVGHAANGIVNIVINIGVGFNPAGVGMIRSYAPVTFVIGP